MSSSSSSDVTLFVRDLLDLPPEACHPPPFFSDDGARFDLSQLLRSSALAVNLAFHQAWRGAFGAPATRVDFVEFVAALPRPPELTAGLAALPPPQRFMALAAQGVGHGVAGLSAALVQGTPLRLAPQQAQQQLLAAAADRYHRTLAVLTQGGDAAAARLLVAKLRDRFGAPAAADELADGDVAAAAAASADAAEVARAYAELVLSDPALPLLERWAEEKGQLLGASEVRGPGRRPPPPRPRSIGEYYARAGAAGAALGLPLVDPLTGFASTPSAAMAGSDAPHVLSCVEQLRRAFARDGYLWRRDSNGTLLLVDDAVAPGRLGALRAPTFGYRQLRAPARLVLCALPPRLYAHVFVVCEDEGAARELSALPIARATRLLALPLAQADLADLATDARAAPAHLAAPALPVARVCASVPLGRSLGEGPWLPLHDAAFLGGCPSHISRAAWVPELRERLWAEAIATLPAARQAPPPAPDRPALLDGGGLVRQFVARYAALRRLATRTFVSWPPPQQQQPQQPQHILLAIDSRRNVWTLLSLLVALDNLRSPERWAVVVLCGEDNAAWFREHLLPRVPHAVVRPLPALGAALDVEEAYNALMTDPATWREVEDAAGGWARTLAQAQAQEAGRRVLLVQDDGLLVRRGLEDDAELMAQDFVGAPWDPELTPGYAETLRAAGVATPDLVGNGGLSLRSLSLMRSATEQRRHGRQLFNGDLQAMPEDVFFAAAAARAGRACPRAVAARFAFEEVAPAASSSSPPLGFHKPWPYVARRALVGYLDVALAEAASRRD